MTDLELAAPLVTIIAFMYMLIVYTLVITISVLIFPPERYGLFFREAILTLIIVTSTIHYII